MWVAPDLADDDGPAAGRGGDCTIWLEADLSSTIQHAADFDRKAQRADRATYRTALLAACTVAYHEAGHALGLSHSETGVMAPQPKKWAPYECKVWTRVQMYGR